LVDLNGAVVGINSAIATGGTGGYIGYGFAIPINMAKSVSSDLIAHGKISRGYIGINIDEVDYAMAKSVGLDKPRGIIVQGVLEGGAASKSDIKEGDIILKVDGKEVNQPNELQSYIASKSAGTKVSLTIFRDRKEIERTVTLKARDNEEKTEPVVNKESDDEGGSSKSSSVTFDGIGMSVRNLNSTEKSKYKLDGGAIITEVQPFSKAEDQRLGEGLVIVEADKKEIKNVNDLKEVINNKKGSAILMKVQNSEGNSRYVGIEIPG
jgi:serine protease Do